MAMDHILAATDLTERSEHALLRALQLKPQSGRVTALHVVGCGLPEELAAEQQTRAKSFLAQRLEHFAPDQRASCYSVVASGSVFGSIIGEANARAADLIVVGKPGFHPYADLFTGTTAERIIRFSDRPVLMVKQAPRGSYQRVLVAFDGSEAALRALRSALTVAPEAEFRVVHAWWPPHVSLGDIEAARQELAEQNERLKKQVSEAAWGVIAASASSAKVKIDLVENNPFIVISNESSWADLLVMGTHSKGRLASTVSIGRLVKHLLVESSCDVLISRP
jgi:nucleotide-binding universal stress UspA family protein